VEYCSQVQSALEVAEAIDTGSERGQRPDGHYQNGTPVTWVTVRVKTCTSTQDKASQRNTN